jgi:hypothetical protein
MGWIAYAASIGLWSLVAASCVYCCVAARNYRRWAL